MRRKDGFCPDWTWWIHSGERLALGIDLRLVMRGEGVSLSKEIRRGLEMVYQGIQSGEGIVFSMRRAGMLLSAEIWSVLEAGEHTGRLGEAMRDVGNQLREKQRLRRQLTGQLWYPAMVMGVGMAVMCLMLFWIIPQMRDVCQSMGAGTELPWLTEHIGPLYGALSAMLLMITVFLMAGAFVLGFLGRRSERWGERGERIIGVFPWVSGFRIRHREARLLRQLSTLLKGGVTLPRSLDMIAQSTPNQWVRSRILEFRTRLLMGAGFPDAVTGCVLIGPESAPLLMAGQESGHLEDYMERVARELDERTQWQVDQVTRLLEPAMLLGLSMAIGGLVLAYLLPMVRMFEQLA